MLRAALIALAVAAPALAAAEGPAPEGASISGVVSGFDARMPLPGARVRIQPESGEALERYTDAMGSFSAALPPGRYSLEIWAEGFESFSHEEVLGEGEQLQLTYRLRPVEEGIVITAERVRSEVSRTVVTMDELRSVPGSFGDPIRALQTLPGVARPSALEGDLAVRGAEASNTAYLVDELPIPYMFHLLVGRSVINPALVEQVAFYPGGLPPRFGDSLQAAVNVTIRPPGEGGTGRVSADVLDGSVALEHSLSDALSLRVAGRYSWISGLLAAWSARAVSSGAGDAVFLNPRYWDGWGDIDWRPAPGHRISLTAFGARDAFLLADPREDEGIAELLPFDPQLLVDSYFVRGRLRWDYTGEGVRVKTWLAMGPERQQSLFEPGLLPAGGPSQGRVEQLEAILRHELTVRATDWLYLEGGFRVINGTGEAWDYADALLDPSAEIPYTLERRTAGAGWVEARVLAGSWNLSPGLRVSGWQWGTGEAQVYEPRMTARYQLGERWWVKGFAGRFGQIPELERTAEGLGNPELGLQTSTQAVAGVEGEFGGAWFMDASVWQTWMQDLVVQDLQVEVRSAGDRATETIGVNYEAVAGRAYGLELLLRLRPESRPWWGWFALSLGRAERTGEEGSFPADRDQPLSATLLAAWDLPARWQISARARYTSGQPFTPYTGVYDPDSLSYRPLPGATNSDRFEDFRQLDARVQKTWRTPRRDWTAYLDVFNATYAKNPFAAAYNYDYTELVPLYSIPILPILGVECVF